MTKTLKCISPIDGSVFAERPVLSLDDAQAVAASARAAQADWAARPLKDRIDLVMAGVAAIGAMAPSLFPTGSGTSDTAAIAGI